MNFRITSNLSPLESIIWEFVYLDGTIYLNKYMVYIRKTKAHKWSSTGRYDRLSQRDSTIEEKDVPLTDEIKAAAHKKFTEKISVKKWSERI